MTREVLFEKMKDLPNPTCRVNLIQQVWEIMNSETEELKKKNKELDGLLGVGTIFNKALNSMNKALEEERGKYRNMVFDQKDLLTKAKGHIENLLYYVKQCTCEKCNHAEIEKDIHKFSFSLVKEAEKFLKECE